MSVLACGRAHCERIMCDRLIVGQYICEECWHELLAHKKTWPTTMPVTEVSQRIGDFMDTPRSTVEAGQVEIEAEFARLTRTIT